ncbi:hypothetical protein F441_13929 [Phytophthora nicotianae CJ01A1]|nr:hypothetical protein F441_13929 [Phytophthora nicotianae CJ01A1]
MRRPTNLQHPVTTKVLTVLEWRTREEDQQNWQAGNMDRD